jgi:hypothetical protein
MAEKKQEANVFAIEGGDTMHAVGNGFDEKIGWLRSIATTWIRADPEDAVACSVLGHIESVIRKLDKRSGSSPDAIAESRELALDIVALVEAVMTFQAERAIREGQAERNCSALQPTLGPARDGACVGNSRRAPGLLSG